MRGGRKGIWINDGWKIPIYDEKYKRTYSRSSKNPTQKKHKDANGHHSQLMKTGVKENNCWEFPGGQVAGSLPSNSRSEGSVPCGKQIPHDVWPSQKKIFFNWAIVKCLEKKGQDTPTEQKITVYFWSETMQTIGQQNDAVKLQKKIKNLPCPTAWSSIACQKRNQKGLQKSKIRESSCLQETLKFGDCRKTPLWKWKVLEMVNAWVYMKDFCLYFKIP